MIKVEHIETWGFEHAIRGMRNPLNSHERSDSYYGCTGYPALDAKGNIVSILNAEKNYVIGEKDMDLMQRLYKAGSVHRKYLRQIFVSMDITAPLYWWKEMDTYKVGVTSDSCSTMCKIHAKEFTLDDFSHEELSGSGIGALKQIIAFLNEQREKFTETENKDYWWQMIQILPSSYNQRRTITMNYENVVSIIQWRSEHKLDEWRKFCEILMDLPYVREIKN